MARFPNDYIPQGEFAECDSADDAMNALRTILKAARAGEFDDELEDLRERRQHHAKKMILARNKCGFHAREKEQPLALPAPSEMPMVRVGFGQPSQPEAPQAPNA